MVHECCNGVVDEPYPQLEHEELLDIELPTREFHTLGGFLTSHIGRIPITGDSVEEFGYRFTVIEGTARAPEKIRIEPV